MTYGDTVVLDGEVSLLNQIDGIIDLNVEIEGEVGVITKVVEHDLPVYTGATTVKPDLNGTVLKTAQKIVLSDITVNPIQVESVSNPTGGRTVYIGGII